MEIFFIKALQLILSLSLLVVLHEGGHFLFAKLFKIRVEKFCLFFDPKFTLFKFKPKRSDTTYALGWLPLGGYVKIAGMIDESMDTEQMKQPVQPWEFRAKPAWQRLLVMLGGVLVNFVVAFLLYAVVLFTWGETYVPIRNMTHGFKFNEEAQKIGFRDGDILLGTDHKTYKKFDSSIYRDLSEAHSARVLRQGKEMTISMPGDLNMLTMIKEQPRFVEVLMPSLIDSIVPGSPAAKAGLQAGSRVVAYNGKQMQTINEFSIIAGTQQDILASASAADSAKLQHASVVVLQPGRTVADTVQLTLGKDYKMGIMWHNPMNKEYATAHEEYGLLASIPAGVSHGWHVLTGYVDDLKYLFTADGAKSVGSFATIGDLFPKSWDWCMFWELTAFISLMLAFINILPIPALDGGHAFFLLCEIVMRRKLSDKFMERAQMIGMVLLMALMAFALFNDFCRFIL